MKQWSPKDIEDKKSQNDMGIMLYRIYEGAISEGASRLVAFLIVAAFVYGMLKVGNEGEEEDVH